MAIRKFSAARVGDQDNDDEISGPDTIISGSPTVFIGDGPFPIVIAKAPGVSLIGGAIVYDDTPAGQAASIADETSYDPRLPIPDSPPPAVNEDREQVECADFPTVITVAHMAKMVSTHFPLSSCRELPVAQRNLTAAQIACNWKALCLAVLDKVRDAGFNFSFNSGFRNASRDSGGDHGIGCAADISCGSQTIAMYRWMIANEATLGFSQIIYEKHNSAWVHVSYNGKGPKGAARMMWTMTGTAPYIFGVLPA